MGNEFDDLLDEIGSAEEDDDNAFGDDDEGDEDSAFGEDDDSAFGEDDGDEAVAQVGGATEDEIRDIITSALTGVEKNVENVLNNQNKIMQVLAKLVAAGVPAPSAPTKSAAPAKKEAQAEAPKRGRGRPPGSKNKTSSDAKEDTGELPIKVAETILKVAEGYAKKNSGKDAEKFVKDAVAKFKVDPKKVRAMLVANSLVNAKGKNKGCFK